MDACVCFSYANVHVHVTRTQPRRSQAQPHHRASWHMKLPSHHHVWIITRQHFCVVVAVSCATVHRVSSSNPPSGASHEQEIIQNWLKNARFSYITQSCYQVKLLAQTRQHAKTQRFSDWHAGTWLIQSDMIIFYTTNTQEGKFEKGTMLERKVSQAAAYSLDL